AIAQSLAAVTGRIKRIDTDVARLAAPVIIAGNVTAVFSRVDDVRVRWVVGRVAGFTAAAVVPMCVRDTARAEAVARSTRGAEILHRAGNVVRRVVVDGYVIELRNGQGRRKPAFAPVERNIHAAVIAGDQALGIAGIDPEIVVVAVVQ